MLLLVLKMEQVWEESLEELMVEEGQEVAR
jgi:hypothetical protein